jgi:hypothetical protein
MPRSQISTKKQEAKIQISTRKQNSKSSKTIPQNVS